MCTLIVIVPDVEGVYLLTSGVPDQPADMCQSYVEETVVGRQVRLHVILFNVDDRDVLANGGAPDTAGKDGSGNG